MLSDEEIIYAKSLEKYCDDPIPSYFEFLNKTWISFQEFGLNFTRYPCDFYFPLEIINSIKMPDVFTVVMIAAFFTFLRISITAMILNVITIFYLIYY